MTLKRQMQRGKAVDSLKTTIAKLEDDLRLKEATITYERAQRVAAQRGLVPYVRAVQRLNEWLQAHRGPITKGDLVTVLKEQGLHNVSVGYDPEDDPEVQAAIEAGAIPLLKAMA